MVVGNLAHSTGTGIGDFGDEIGGFQLAFVTFPAALGLLPGAAANVTCLMFFVLLMLLGFDSSMAGIE